MELLSLPPELIHNILHFVDWDDILSFISTTKYVTDSILSKSDISRLRRNCRDRLLFWETERRIERGWSVEPNVKRGAWSQHAQRYGQRIMSPWYGARNDPDTLEEIPDTLPAQYDVSAHDKYGRQPRIEGDEYWWWTYSHICALCAAEAGYTMEQVLNSEPRKDTLRAKMKQRNRRSMLASLERRQDRGRKMRASLGIQEPCGLLDIERMKLEDDPFPKFQPAPVLLYRGQALDEEWKAQILNHMNGKTSAAQIQADIDKRRNTMHPSVYRRMDINNQ
ncbi:uncharacterized protein N0V89_010404 [Didymosphaeria variabile]|uniref:F-box domain-containing protein n=1 Tax=Didymosphaeria variabile TaxID=1932322 RepID=A0A9W9C5G9_9PLEO|nr:uncharacterized protein N0V89_010404 [Didymosphaeria variabile]KAJ4346475.1 hypothetical protein N0V89_010404 [Didymosphaeria variabile]